MPPVAGASARKLHGRAFYESIGSPKVILAPMVDQSEFAWRLLTRSFMDTQSGNPLLAYTPMFHSRLFAETSKYRATSFQALRPSSVSSADSQIEQPKPEDYYLDGNPALDRPLFVQFCSNSPEHLSSAAQLVEPFCDAVDLNLGCPQGIAKKGHYGAFLQEDWLLIYQLINKLHNELSIPVTAKMRILETKERTLDYAKMILDAGASIITVHGRQRDQKGHNTGLADWSVLRYLRDHLPSDTVLFANGNILQHEDIDLCLEATGADAVMSAEANLCDPSIFSTPPPIGQEGREYWRGRDGKGGYRMDAVFRRYMDIIYKHVLDREPPIREPLFIVSDLEIKLDSSEAPRSISQDNDMIESSQRGLPKDKKYDKFTPSANLQAMQAHLFQLLRPLLSKHTHVRDALAKTRSKNINAFENVLEMVEHVTKQGLIEYGDGSFDAELEEDSSLNAGADPDSSSSTALNRCKRPWWVCQSYVRPLPHEAIAKGAIVLSKKEKARLADEQRLAQDSGCPPGGKVEHKPVGDNTGEVVELPKQGLVCG